MVSRRELAGMIGMGSVAAALAAASSAPARAQGAEQSTFDRVMSTKKIRVGGVATGTPWWWKDQSTGEWGGQFADMSKALAADTELELEVVETTWGNAVLDLQANKIDLMFGLNPTPKRALAIDFSVPVYDSALLVIARPDFEVTTWAALNDPAVKIAVDVGSAHDQVASRLCPNAQIIRFKSIDEATLALRSRRADVQVIFWMGGVRAVKRDSSLGAVAVPQPFFGSTSNIGFRRETDKTWRDFVNVWVNYARGIGVVREAVLKSLEQVDITLDDLPPGVTF